MGGTSCVRAVCVRPRERRLRVRRRRLVASRCVVRRCAPRGRPQEGRNAPNRARLPGNEVAGSLRERDERAVERINNRLSQNETLPLLLSFSVPLILPGPPSAPVVLRSATVSCGFPWSTCCGWRSLPVLARLQIATVATVATCCPLSRVFRPSAVRSRAVCGPFSPCLSQIPIVHLDDNGTPLHHIRIFFSLPCNDLRPNHRK